jgi:hypothetical protein
VERQQLRWVALVAALVPLVVLVANLTGHLAVRAWAIGVYVALLPLAIGAAILRYRLYDLDRIVSRTLAYGLLTVLLGPAYAGVVLGLGRLLPQDSSLAVAGATLAVAVAFQPARAASSGWWTGASTGAATTPPRPSRRSAAGCERRSTWTPLSAELLAVVKQTMQPTQASLWLRPQSPSGMAGAAVARQRT